MTRAAAFTIGLGFGVLAAGWPAAAHAQLALTSPLRRVIAPERTVVARDGHSVPAQPPSTADHQPRDPQAEDAEPQPATPVPPITDADRAAAFPDVEGHALQDHALHYFVLFDQLEVQRGESGNGVTWDSTGWVGHATGDSEIRIGLRPGHGRNRVAHSFSFHSLLYP